MTLFLNGVFLLTCYPILIFLYFTLRKAHDKNGYCFGTTLKRELKEDEAVKTIVAEYQKNLKKSMIVLAVIIFPVFFIPSVSITMTVWMIWLLIVCFYPSYWLAKGNKQIRELKQERGWEQVSEVAYADLKIASVPRKVKFTTFLPTLLFSTIPLILAFVMFQGDGYNVYVWLVATFVSCTYLFYGCAVWTDRQKITVICEDSEINTNFARAKKQAWKNYWLACGWLNGVFTWLVLLFMWQRDWGMMGLIWGSVGYGLVVIGVTYWLIRKLKNINDIYEPKRTIIDEADDDRHWFYGLCYYNKNDKHIMVENRMGTGTTMNMATGVGKGMYLFSALAMLSIPAVCGWLIMVEFTPLDARVVDDRIVCTHLSVEYEIPLEDIEEYEVITDLPSMIKVNGTGMDNLLSGTFEIYREGMFETFLNPQNELFIKIITADEMYYISGVDDAATQAVIDEIENR